MGNSENKPEYDNKKYPFLKFSQTNSEYYPTESVSGEFELNLTSKELVIGEDIEISIQTYEAWAYDEDTNSDVGRIRHSDHTNYTLCTTPLNIKDVLKEPFPIKLSNKCYSFNFSLSIPEANPSLETKNNSYGCSINHYLQASIKSQNKEIKIGIPFTIRAGPKIIQNAPLTQFSIDPDKIISDSKGVKIKVSYPSTNFALGEEIPLEVEIDNTQGEKKTKGVNVEVFRTLSYSKPLGKPDKVITSSVFSKGFPFEVEVGKKGTFKAPFSLDKKNIPCCEGKIIKCTHEIKISMKKGFFGFFGKDVVVTMPLSLTNKSRPSDSEAASPAS